MTKDTNRENIPKLTVKNTISVHYKLANNDIQTKSKFLHTIVPIRGFGQLTDLRNAYM